MKFFNPKEEVLDIQLTQQGKRLLSMGKFMPKYYAFYDDDIIYDYSYAGVIEHQNQSEKRIKEETPRLHTQYTFTGLQEQITKLTNNEADLNNGSVDIQPTAEKMYCLGEPLGNVPPGIKHAPAWEVQYLRGRLSGSTEFITGSYHQPIRIPQLSSSIEYKTYVTFISADGLGLERDYLEHRKYKGKGAPGEAGQFGQIDWDDEDLAFAELAVNAGPYEDGSVLQVEEDHLLLHVLEHNTDFLKENFDVEIYMNEGNAVNEKNEQYPIYKQLYFAREDEPITPNHVEYWFEYAFDEGILDEVICDSDLDLSKRNNMLTDIEITCEDRDTPGGRNIYDVDVEEPEEPC